MLDKEGPETFRVGIDEEAQLRQDCEPNVFWSDVKMVMVTVGMVDSPQEPVLRRCDMCFAKILRRERGLDDVSLCEAPSWVSRRRLRPPVISFVAISRAGLSEDVIRGGSSWLRPGSGIMVGNLNGDGHVDASVWLHGSDWRMRIEDYLRTRLTRGF